MSLVRSFALSLLALAGAAHGQSILNQFSTPFDYQVSVPFWEFSQFAAPDGVGGMLLFSLTDNSLRRFDSTGKQLWSIAFDFGSAQGVVAAMAVTADGVLLGGQVTGALPGQSSAGSYDAFVAKYDFNGKNVWTRQFGTANGDYTRVIAVGPAGFYVLGVTDGPNRLFIRNSDPNGNEIWTRNFSDASLVDIIGGAADSTGIYFFGSAAANVLRQFDSAGNDVLSYTFDHAAIITGVAADGQGVYVSYLDGAPASNVSRIDLTGHEVWKRQVDASQIFNMIFTDGTGFYIAGGANAALPGQCYAGNGDIFLTRFDPSGNPLWTREFGTAAFERTLQVSITNSTVYVTSLISDSTVSLTALSKSSTATTGSQPSILNECVLNAASYLGGGVAPGEIVTIVGSGLGPAQLVQLQTSGGQIATTLGGTQILFNGEPAPMIYASDSQSSAIVPYDLAGQTTVNVQVQYNGVVSKAVTLPVFDTRLGIFSFGETGSGQAAVINQDGSVNSPSNPAAANSIVSIYATGGGLANPPGADNQITGSAASSLKGSVFVRLYSDGGDPEIASYPATVLYYGGAPQTVPGLVQINAQLPATVPSASAMPLYVGFDSTGAVEQVITIAIR